MPDISFGDFLNRMTGETGSERRPKTKKPINEAQKPKKRKIYEEEEKIEKKEEPKPKKENNMSSNNSSSDDIVVKALDYSTRFLKVIYDNFKNEKDRRVVLKSIRSAIDLALGDETSTPIQAPIPKPKETNENISVRMNDLSGQEVSIDPKQYYSEAERPQTYKKGLNLGLKVNNEGKREVDLSNISQNDIYEMRILAGVDPEQKKREQSKQGINIEEIERGDN